MLTAGDKRWLRKAMREEFKSYIDELLASDTKQIGGYDGATPVTDDDHADESKRRVGFQISNGHGANDVK